LPLDDRRHPARHKEQPEPQKQIVTYRHHYNQHHRRDDCVQAQFDGNRRRTRQKLF
jgi:hypothetical protein